MIMKKTIFIIAILLCIVTSIKAQTFTISQIKNVEWVSHDFDDSESGMKFTDTEYYDMVTYYSIGRKLTAKHPYYLSASRPDKFNASYVGKNTQGKYVVVNVQNKRLWVFELIQVTNDKIVVNFHNDKAIGGGQDVIRTFYKKK